MKKRINILKVQAVFACLFFMGCASVGVTVTKNYPAKSSNCQLDIYTSESEIKKEYEVICLIDSKTGSTLGSKKTIANAIELAKPKACESGADAILFISGDKGGLTLTGWGEGKAIIKGIKYK